VAIESIEKDFGTDYAKYLGIEPVAPLTSEQTQILLQQVELQTKLKPALVYLAFKPQSNIAQTSQNRNLWTFNSGKPAKQPLLNQSEKNTDQLELILISASGQTLSIPIKGATRQQVMSVVEEFQKTITNPRRPSAYRQPSQQLYQWFIAPLERELQGRKIDTLVFIVDEGLRSVPMAALYDGSKFLIERYGMGMMPSLALTDTRYKDMTQERVLAMGASQFNRQNPLPAVPLELSVIADRIWKGQSYLNNTFTLSNLQQAHASGEFGIIHLATHANFETGKLNNSYIQLWNSQLTLDQLKQLNLGDPPVELLVLSACRTALGDRESELGFAGAAVLAKVKTVLGSLWEVNDEGTLGLMISFYEQLREIPIKVTAIRQAQLSLLRGEVYLKDGYLITPKNRLALPPQLAELTAAQSVSPRAGLLTHPYYWSGFTLIGSPW
jgi:CHAT domain-containing protein